MIIADKAKIKYILPCNLHTLRIVPLKAIHNDGVVGFKKVIRNPAKKLLDEFEVDIFSDLEFKLLVFFY